MLPAVQTPPEAYDFLWRPHPKQSNHYRLELNFDLPGNGLTIRAELIQTVGTRDRSGAFSVTSTTKDVRVITDADAQTLPQEPPTVEKFDATGRRLSHPANSGPADSRDVLSEVLERGTDFMPPATAVKVGQKWSSVLKGNPALGVAPSKSEYRFLGIDRRAGKKLLHVRFAYAETSGAHPIQAGGYFYIDPVDFSIVECQTTIHNARISEDLPPGDIDVRMIRH